MNFIKEISIILISCLLFAAGLVIYFHPDYIAPALPDAKNREEEIKKLRQVEAKGSSYPDTGLGAIESKVVDWLSPPDDDDNWDYDLFSALEVLWDPTIKEYVPRNRKPVVVPPFGIKLIYLGYPTYPYLLSHSRLGTSRKEEDRLFTIKNVKNKIDYFEDCKLNQPITGAPHLTLKSYKTVRGKDSDGVPFVRNVLTIEDREFGRTVEIDDEKPLEFKGRVDIVFASETDPTWTLTLQATPDLKLKKGEETFTYNEDKYIIKDIDLKAKQVSLDKTFVINKKKNKYGTDSQTLGVPPPVTSNPTKANPPASTSATPSSNPASIAQPVTSANPPTIK